MSLVTPSQVRKVSASTNLWFFKSTKKLIAYKKSAPSCGSGTSAIVKFQATWWRLKLSKIVPLPYVWREVWLAAINLKSECPCPEHLSLPISASVSVRKCRPELCKQQLVTRLVVGCKGRPSFLNFAAILHMVVINWLCTVLSCCLWSRAAVTG